MDIEVFLFASYHYASIAQPSNTSLIVESFLAVSNTLWGFGDCLLFPSNTVWFCVNPFKKKKRQKKGHCRMFPFSEMMLTVCPCIFFSDHMRCRTAHCVKYVCHTGCIGYSNAFLKMFSWINSVVFFFLLVTDKNLPGAFLRWLFG